MTMYRKKKQVKLCGILMCPLAIGCSAFIQMQEGNDPIRTTAVKRFIRLPLGMTVSLPVIEYAKEVGATKEQLYRALLLANLVTLHEKEGIGRLSAYCGAVSAGAGAGAGIAWLCGGDYQAVIHTIVNALAITSGIVCDGAKASCAAKISAAVDAGILGFEMYRNGQQFYGGDGLVLKGVENTIRNISRLGRIGMKETDKEIIDMMIGK